MTHEPSGPGEPDGGQYSPEAPPLKAWAAVEPHVAPDGEIDVIVPIYGGYEETLLALHRLLTART